MLRGMRCCGLRQVRDAGGGGHSLGGAARLFQLGVDLFIYAALLEHLLQTHVNVLEAGTVGGGPTEITRT